MFHKCICWLQCSKIDPDLEMFLRCSHSFLGTLAPSVRWSSYAEFREAVRLEAEMECMVDTLVDTHLVLPNLPE